MIIHNLYLGKYKKLPYNELNEIEKDLALLVCKDNNRMKELAKGSKLREKIMSGYRGIVKDEKLLKEIFDPEWDRLCILNSEKSIAREEGHAEGHAEGRAEGRIEGKIEGRIEGIAEGKKEIAKSLLKTDMSLEEISKHTNLSIEELEIIKNN